MKMGKFSIGDVLSNTFSTYGQNVVSFSVFYACCMIIPAILGTVAATPIFIWMSTLGSSSGVVVSAIVGIALGLFILAMIMAGFLGVIHGAISSMDGQRPSIGTCLSAGLSTMIKGILASLVAITAFVIGLLPMILTATAGAGGITFVLGVAFYVGMIIAACVYFPIGGVIAKESRGVFASFSRAADLTRGNRWRIFGMILVWIVISFVGTALLFLVMYVLGISPEDVAASEFELDGVRGILTFIIYLLYMLAIYVLSSVNVGVLYVRLRDIVDGIGPDAAARVFD